MPKRLLLISIALMSAACSAAHAAERANLVFIIADDMTFREIGCYGGQAHTPNIDRLATEGMQFSHCFQSAPMCSPTRHNIYTGLYPVRSGGYPNHTFAKAGTKSIVHYLKPLGYRVALSGKTHIGPKDVFPFEYSGKKNPDMEVIETLITESREANTPFCLFACSNEPHTPWDKGDPSRYPTDKIELPPYIVDTPVVRSQFRKYLAEITYYDDQVGQILALLDKYDQRDNTLVIVVSEQGNGFPFAKWTCYDHGLQSAMIARWPGKIAAASKTSALVEYCDIASTLVEASGGDVPPGLDGKSFLPVLMGQSDTHKEYSYGIMTTRGINDGSDSYPIRSIRDKKWRLIWNLEPKTKFENACSTSPSFRSMVKLADSGDENAKKLVHNYHYRPELELYDCETDVMQMQNLADEPDHQEHVARLHNQLKDWMSKQGDEGIRTEHEAPARQTRYRRDTVEKSIRAYRKRREETQAKNGKKAANAG